MKKTLNSEQIYIFSTIVEKKSFSKAANSLGVHVSTMTRRMDELENILNVKLFIRSSRYLGLTEQGSYLYQQSKNILQSIANATEGIQKISESENGSIRLSCLPTFGKVLITPYIRANSTLGSGLHFFVNLTERLVDPITERLDVSIRIGEQPDSSLYRKKIGEQHWKICGSPTLLSQLDDHNLKNLQNLPIIDKCQSKKSLCWLGIENNNDVVVQCDDFYTQLQLAIDGIGICCLPNWVVIEAIRRGELIEVIKDPFFRFDPIYALRPFLNTNIKISKLLVYLEDKLSFY